ncbi:MAG: sugar phosphate isomerase/epimerase [Kiritimatiellae bacterium]|nr:sugar phosphate isomerase/epimerase [Kiritimatiellia bacterium]
MKIRPQIGVLGHLKPDASNIDKVADFGLGCTQVCSWDLSLATKEIARKVRETAARRNVRLTAMWGGYSGPACWNFTRGPVTLGLVPATFRRTRLLELKRWADFAAEAGAPALITHFGFLPENMTDPEFEPVAVAIDEIARYCKDLGLGFWFETGQETPVTLLRFIEEVGLDNLGINLDPANLLMYGKGNPVDALRVFGKYVRAIHAKDGMPPTTGKQLGPEVKVGTGSVRYPEFLPALLDCGFRGDLTIEREIHGDEQDRDIRDTIGYLSGLLDAYETAHPGA